MSIINRTLDGIKDILSPKRGGSPQTIECTYTAQYQGETMEFNAGHAFFESLQKLPLKDIAIEAAPHFSISAPTLSHRAELMALIEKNTDPNEKVFHFSIAFSPKQSIAFNAKWKFLQSLPQRKMTIVIDEYDESQDSLTVNQALAITLCKS